MCSLLASADEAHARECADHGAKVRAVGALLASDEWKGNGARDLASFLAARWDLTGRSARELVREAQALRERPAVIDALCAAEISIDQARAVAVLADAEVWLENIERYTMPELEREARKAVARELERKDDGVYLRTFHTKDERYLRGEFQLHPEDGAVVVAALDSRIPENTPLQRLDHMSALALVELARGSTSSGPPVVLSVADPNDVASLSSGGLVPPETAARLACDARPQVGTRTSRTISPALRRAVEDRDNHMCAFPGCEMTAFLECHHVVHFKDGGPTSLPNLILLCWRHHKLVHEQHWSLTGEAGPHIKWVRPDGAIFEPRVRVDTS